MLYTRSGDKGTTKTIRASTRISKAAPLAEALGALDEVNSFLGLAKVRSAASGIKCGDKKFSEILHTAQQNLFIVQAELAGAPKTIDEKKVWDVEAVIDGIEKELPPIRTFFIPGGTELAAFLDVARTMARRAERRVIAALKAEKLEVGAHTLAYLNRLSSLLYALARLSNHTSGVTEEPPTYT